MAGKMKEIITAEYRELIAQKKSFVLDFYSTECPPCEALVAKLVPLSDLYGDDLTIAKIYRQGNRDLAEELGVRGSPTALFFKDGVEVGKRLSGGIRRTELVEQFEKLISPDRAEELRGKEQKTSTECDLLILGAGPAGLTAAIYGAQAKLSVIQVDTALAGGQVSTTHLVSNYPGFEEPINGYMLAHHMSEQAKKYGTAQRLAVDVTEIDLENRRVVLDGVETISAKKIILATGASPNFLGIPGEKEYHGHGISYCATCDAKYYEGKHVVVIGGGNSAIEEALYIDRFTEKITMIYRGNRFNKANKTALEKIDALVASGKIVLKLGCTPTGFSRTPEGKMIVKTHETEGERTAETEVDGVFIFAGMKPNIAGLENSGLKISDKGCVVVDKEQHTNIPHVFAVGDMAQKKFRQITIAVAEGTVAAIQAEIEIEQERD